MVRNTYIYPPQPSMRIVSDIFSYTSQRMPKFNSISISGYHMQEAGATADLELAYTIADGIEYARAGVAAGLDIDSFAPRLSFFWAVGMNFFMEVAKMRAARLIWAALMQKNFAPKDEKSLALRTHSQTSGWSLTAQDPMNNIIRTMVEAMAATQGHTQSLHTNSFDEALALPTDHSARIARNTQDPATEGIRYDRYHRSLGRLGLRRAARRMIWLPVRSPISKRSNRSAAWQRRSKRAFRKLRIEEAAARTQARIDSGHQTVVGVNFSRPEQDIDVDVLKVDNSEVRARQLSKLQQLKGTTRNGGSGTALRALTDAARNGTGNLLDFAVRAARARATVGEISLALEKAYGRHVAEIRDHIRASIARRSAPPIPSSTRPSPRSKHSAGARGESHASSSPRWGRTAMTAAKRSSPPPSPTSASMSSSARCSRRRRKSPILPCGKGSTSSVLRHSPPVI